MLQEFLNFLLALRLSDRELQVFFANEHEVPIYVKKQSKKAVKHGKPPIMAVPSNSFINGDSKDIEEELLENDPVNLEKLQGRYTTRYKSPSTFSSLSPSVSEVLQTQVIARPSGHEFKRNAETSLKVSKVNIEENKTDLVNAVSFTAKIKDMKFKDKKLVISP
eukprot:TRINITY_DN14171_c0_g1_i3.p2 TRINITY_DN14171_c0_g1~~TRINITY_DN14171_c0_g1_i3.p2  ORF type:complete len:164 (-),score=46.77 TRINITY_DN14171_c0_g1_i3:478-969(-)